MIFGNLAFIQRYTSLEDGIIKCFEYAKTHDLKNLTPGSYPIDGNNLFVNIVEYTTTLSEERFWEAHKYYIDLHLMLDGSEQIDINFIKNMEQKPFIEENDFLPLEGPINSMVRLSPNDFLICYPEDAHRTAIQIEKDSQIKKAIFKIKL